MYDFGISVVNNTALFSPGMRAIFAKCLDEGNEACVEGANLINKLIGWFNPD
jgi:hypothetical protein